jgi:hypothetical protein
MDFKVLLGGIRAGLPERDEAAMLPDICSAKSRASPLES